LMLGIMLARPVAGVIAQWLSWHAMFMLSALVMALLALVLYKVLPGRMPKSQLRYRELLASMGQLVLITPILRRRALYQAWLFCAFSLFWTTVPLFLASPAFGLSQAGIALFALAGVAGAIAAPIAGQVADKGWSRAATGLSMSIVAVAFLLCHFSPTGSPAGLALLTMAAILLDFGVSANLVLGQRAIFVLGAEYRSRLNGLYMATFLPAVQLVRQSAAGCMHMAVGRGRHGVDWSCRLQRWSTMQASGNNRLCHRCRHWLAPVAQCIADMPAKQEKRVQQYTAAGKAVQHWCDMRHPVQVRSIHNVDQQKKRYRQQYRTASECNGLAQAGHAKQQATDESERQRAGNRQSNAANDQDNQRGHAHLVGSKGGSRTAHQQWRQVFFHYQIFRSSG
jgi:Major Facilitator Superfamily